jgi:hypothetical protein
MFCLELSKRAQILLLKLDQTTDLSASNAFTTTS